MKGQHESRRGLLLVGHGTQDPDGSREFRQLVALVAQRLPDVDVQPAFIEFDQPTVEAGVQQLQERKVPSITVIPILLFGAGHAKVDLPRSIAAAKRETGLQQICQAQHLGCHPKLVELSAERCREALAGEATATYRSSTLVVLVGRGSHDADATREMHQFAASRQALDSSLPIRVGFLAMAAPSLEEVIQEVRSEPYRRVVVQPHLLFRGALLDRIHERIAEVDRQQEGQHWSVAEHLRPVPELAEIVVDRDRGEVQV